MYDLRTLKTMGLWRPVSKELKEKYHLKSKDLQCDDGCEEEFINRISKTIAKEPNDFANEICCMAENLERNRNRFWH